MARTLANYVSLYLSPLVVVLSSRHAFNMQRKFYTIFFLMVSNIDAMITELVIFI